MAQMVSVSPVADPLLGVQAVRQYGKDARHYRERPRLSQCPRCRCKADAPGVFRRHGVRLRWFLVVVGNLVHKVASAVGRWRCVRCKRTFTWYPPFAVPYKRYVVGEMLRRCRAYVEREDQGYRQGVEEQGRPVFHEQPLGERITAESTEQQKAEERVGVLAPTTLYRWVSALGAGGRLVARALHLIKQKDPQTAVFRELAGLRIAPGKSRNGARRGVLRRCWRLCVAEAAFVATFGVSIFHQVGNGVGLAMG